MKKKCEIVASNIPLSIRCTNFDYLKDYHVLTKMDNPEVIINFIIQSFKEGNNIRFKDIHIKPIGVYSCKKRKQKAAFVLKGVQKSSKIRVFEKEVEEVVASTVIIPSKTISGKSPTKDAFVYVISKSPLRKKRIKKLPEIEEEEENVSLFRKKKNAGNSVQKKAIEPSPKLSQLLASDIFY